MDRIPVRESGIGEEILHKDIFIEQSWVVIRTSYSLAMTSVLMVSRHKRIIQSINERAEMNIHQTVFLRVTL